MNNQITISELQNLSENDYILIDIRSNYDFSYGHINNSVNIPQDEMNIFRSVENVDLNAVIKYKDKTGIHHFPDDNDN